jgi:hypothetical protein
MTTPDMHNHPIDSTVRTTILEHLSAIETKYNVLQVSPQLDVIELPISGELDINGIQRNQFS